MNNYEFTLVLDRVPTDEEIDALYDAGCDDAAPEADKGESLLHFDRESDSLGSALLSAIKNVEQAGLTVAGVKTNDLVSIKDIANRLNRSPESVRLAATGQRGPGGFPTPMSSSNWALYSWAQVRDWYASNSFVAAKDADKQERVLAAVDHVLRARRIVVDEDAGRETLEELIKA